MKRLFYVFAASFFVSCSSPNGNDNTERVRHLTPGRENFKFTQLAIDSAYAEIFIEFKNGQYGGKNPELHFLIDGDSYWTRIYKRGWIDSDGAAWLADTAKVLVPRETYYTDLPLWFRATPEDIEYLWIEVVW